MASAVSSPARLLARAANQSCRDVLGPGSVTAISPEAELTLKLVLLSANNRLR